MRRSWLSDLNVAVCGRFASKMSLALAVLFLFSGCFLTKKTVHEPELAEMDVEELVHQMELNKFRFDWLVLKANVTLSIDDKVNSFSASIRMKKDSVVWMSLSALGIEAARVIITPDSIKMLDRVNSKYFAKGFSSVNSLLKVNVDFDMLQCLLVGNHSSNRDEKKLRSSYVDEQLYILSTLRKRQLKRAMEQKENDKKITRDIWREPAGFRITKLSIEDNKTDRELVATYGSFMETERGRLAQKISIRVKSEKPAMLEADYTKFTLDKAQETPFSIPEKYTPIY
jgi:hypothetical protein